jgi:hypothetical protein
MIIATTLLVINILYLILIPYYIIFMDDFYWMIFIFIQIWRDVDVVSLENCPRDASMRTISDQEGEDVYFPQSKMLVTH